MRAAAAALGGLQPPLVVSIWLEDGFLKLKDIF